MREFTGADYDFADQVKRELAELEESELLHEAEACEQRYWGLRAGSIAGSLSEAEQRELAALEIFRAIE